MKYKTLILDREEWANELPYQLNSPDLDICMYGTKMNSGTGVGIYSEEREIVAITLTAREILHRNLNNKKIVICSDSQAYINALGSFTSTSKTVTECKKILSKVTEKCDLLISWVPGHNGIDGNKKADELARDGSDREFIGSEPAVGISSATTRPLIWDQVKNKHNNKWRDSTKFRQSKIYLDRTSS